MKHYTEKQLDKRLEILRAQLRKIDEELKLLYAMRITHSEICICNRLNYLDDELQRLGGTTDNNEYYYCCICDIDDE